MKSKIFDLLKDSTCLGIILLLVLSSANISGQQSEVKPIKALNNYVHFNNECIHGLLIVHRLLELFNQDINKYVDLEGYQLNFFSNADLPKNIFEDPDDWFYTTSPNEWYDVLVRESIFLKHKNTEEMNRIAREMKNICRAVNNSRFEVENYIKDHDLNESTELQGVYDRLERAVKMYNDFFTRQIRLERLINETYKSIGNTQSISVSDKSLIQSINENHILYKRVLRALRAKKGEIMGELIAEVKNKNQALKNNLTQNAQKDRKNKIASNRAIIKTEEAIESAEKFHFTAEVPKEYRLYGKFYYYHNSDIINKMNRYGNGYVIELNNILSSLSDNVLLLMEEPHFFQVIYPKKLIEDLAIASSDDRIDILPTTLKKREVVTNSRAIKVDKLEFEIDLYDHMIQDGDIISLNYNGDWILEEYSLEANPRKLKLKLNASGKNYLLLHAETIGRRPPNTMAISYFYNNKKQEIILKSDLNASEMIEIKYVPASQK